MKIYTKTGDTGETALFGGKRVPKDDLRIEAYGSVDELNSVIGIIRSFRPVNDIDATLALIQNQLFELGADLATPSDRQNSIIPRIKRSQITAMEKKIDAVERRLPPLQAFILPGGTASAGFLHLARTVCRRAERCVVRLARNERIGSDVIVYLNRLSDLLFVLARYANQTENGTETEWHSGKRKVKQKR